MGGSTGATSTPMELALMPYSVQRRIAEGRGLACFSFLTTVVYNLDETGSLA